MGKPQPYIHSQDSEPVAKADCGCTLEDDFEGYPAFWQCPVHAAAPELLEALNQLMSRLDHHGNIDSVREEGPIQDARNAIAKTEGKI